MLTLTEGLIIVHHLSSLPAKRINHHHTRKTGEKEERVLKVHASRVMIPADP